MKLIKIWTLSVIAMGFISSATLAGNIEAPDFRAKVIHVYETGVIRFEGRGRYRLWGIIPKVNYLRELIMGKTLGCHEAGALLGNPGGG